MAQSQFRAPAEEPPSSYKGTQYVDSTGCVYIRAGTAGNVTWVPRVTRDRQPVCGYQPSLAASVRPGGATGTASGATTLTLAQADTGDDPNARILPKHLYKRRQLMSSLVTPKGYKPVWKDDRLNPRRAEQTRAGQEQMSRYWTNTVPRRARNER